MIWLNPWAWLGVLGVALPIAIHLLGRGHARVVRFPTLRFLDASRLLPTKRSRIQDPLLLALRIAIVTVAALALAQPLVMTGGRRRALDRGLARVIIVDTSASMSRGTGRGGRMLDSARSLATRLGAAAQTSIVVQSAEPADVIPGAVAWLAKQGRRADIAIVSDFQRGAIDSLDLRAIPTSVGLVLRGVSPSTSASDVRASFLSGTRTVEARGVATASGTNIRWLPSVGDTTVNIPVALFAGADDAAELDALRTAASSNAVPLPIDSSRAVALVFPGYASRAAVLSALRPARAAWKVDLLAAARRADLAVVAAGDATIDGTSRFVLVTDARPLSLDAARLVSIARHATSSAPSFAELEVETLSDGVLRSIERAPADAVPDQHRPLDGEGPSDARWLWLAVLALLLVEWRLRRTTASARIETEARARAA